MPSITFKVKFFLCVLCLAGISNIQAAPSQSEIDNATNMMDTFKEIFLPPTSNAQQFRESCQNNCFLKSGVLGPAMDSAENWELVGHVAIDLRGQGHRWKYHTVPLIRHETSDVSDRYYVADATQMIVLPLESWVDYYGQGEQDTLALFTANEIGNPGIAPSVSPEKYNKTVDELKSAAEDIDLTEIKIAIFYREFNLKGALSLLAIKEYLMGTPEPSLAARIREMTNIRKTAFQQTAAQAKTILETYYPSATDYLRTRSTGWSCFD